QTRAAEGRGGDLGGLIWRLNSSRGHHGEERTSRESSALLTRRGHRPREFESLPLRHFTGGLAQLAGHPVRSGTRRRRRAGSNPAPSSISKDMTMWKTLGEIKIPDILQFVADASKDGQAVHIGTHSQQTGRHTQFVTVVVILTPRKGGRVADRRDVV